MCYLAGTQSHFGVGGLAELRELGKNGHELIGQCGVSPTQLILKTERQDNRRVEPRREREKERSQCKGFTSVLTISMVTSKFFLVTWAWEKM